MELFKKLKDAEDEFVQDMMKANLVAMQSYAADVLYVLADTIAILLDESEDFDVPGFIRAAADLQQKQANNE